MCLHIATLDRHRTCERLHGVGSERNLVEIVPRRFPALFLTVPEVISIRKPGFSVPNVEHLYFSYVFLGFAIQLREVPISTFLGLLAFGPLQNCGICGLGIQPPLQNPCSFQQEPTVSCLAYGPVAFQWPCSFFFVFLFLVFLKPQKIEKYSFPT